MPELRPMRLDDAPAVFDLAVRCFTDLAERLGLPDEPPPGDPQVAYMRHHHLVRTDPGGCWVAEPGGEGVGAAEAIVREGLWGLSLLIVDPRAQSTGVGTALVRRAHDHAD